MEPDDFVAPMSIETYFEYRVKQALKVSQKTVPRLSRQLTVFETMVSDRHV